MTKRSPKNSKKAKDKKDTDKVMKPNQRHKLSAALTAWRPADRSALALLAPWHRVFDAKSWAALMSRSILPKLGAGLAALQVNPAHQPPESLAPWHDAMAWAPYLAAGQVPRQMFASTAAGFSNPDNVLGRPANQPLVLWSVGFLCRAQTNVRFIMAATFVGFSGC